MEIYAICDLNGRQVGRLKELAGDDVLHLQGGGDGAKLDPAFLQSEVVFGNPPPSWLPQAEALRWIQLCSAGINEYRHFGDLASANGIVFTNASGLFADPVAQSALAGILALYRGIDRLIPLQERKQWIGDPLRAELNVLTGATVVLLGYGSINRRLAELLAPFGCNITHFGRNWVAAELDKALSLADVVVSVAPETDDTIGIFDKARLDLLKNSALFVNFGRGSVVDEDALAAALHDRRIGGAVIDVTQSEPPPSTHLLWTAPNTILTQHSGGGTADEFDRIIDVFSDNLARYRNDMPLAGIVDFERGY